MKVIRWTKNLLSCKIFIDVVRDMRRQVGELPDQVEAWANHVNQSIEKMESTFRDMEDSLQVRHNSHICTALINCLII